MLSPYRSGPSLPVNTLLEEGYWFTPEEVAVLTQAFERALGELGLRDRKDPPGQGRRTRSFATVRARGDADVEMSRAGASDRTRSEPAPSRPTSRSTATVC